MDFNTAIQCANLAAILFDATKEINPVYRKYKVMVDYYIDIFKNQFITSIQELDQNDIQEPNTSVLIPALDECIYYLKEEEIRNMFAKLITSSFNKNMNEYLHPGFIGIIKQLSPFDARLLLSIHDSLELKGIVAISDNVQYKLIETSLLQGVDDVNQLSLSLDNLIRLGLINIDMNSKYKLYDRNGKDVILHSSSMLNKSSKYYQILNNQFELYSANAYITVLGKNFLKVCVD